MPRGAEPALMCVKETFGPWVMVADLAFTPHQPGPAGELLELSLGAPGNPRRQARAQPAARPRHRRCAVPAALGGRDRRRERRAAAARAARRSPTVFATGSTNIGSTVGVGVG